MLLQLDKAVLPTCLIRLKSNKGFVNWLTCLRYYKFVVFCVFFYGVIYKDLIS